jgi:hypothetical protein
MKELEKYITKEVMDEEEMRLLERFWQGEAVTDIEI